MRRETKVVEPRGGELLRFESAEFASRQDVKHDEKGLSA